MVKLLLSCRKSGLLHLMAMSELFPNLRNSSLCACAVQSWRKTLTMLIDCHNIPCEMIAFVSWCSMSLVIKARRTTGVTSSGLKLQCIAIATVSTQHADIVATASWPCSGIGLTEISQRLGNLLTPENNRDSCYSRCFSFRKIGRPVHGRGC